MNSPLRALAVLALTTFAASQSTTTLFAADNNGSSGWGCFFDLQVSTAISITALDVNVLAGAAGPYTVDFYVRSGSYAGTDGSPSGWMLTAKGTVLAPQPVDVPTHVTLDKLVTLQPQLGVGGTYGIALYFTNLSPYYTNGSWTLANTDVKLLAGVVRTALFSGNQFTPRTWNGRIYYRVPFGWASFSWYGQGCPGTNGIPLITGSSGVPRMRIGNLFLSEVLYAPTTPSTGQWLLGTSAVQWSTLPLPYSLAPLGMTGCSLYTSVDLALPFLINGGKGVLSFAVPGSTALVGQSLFMQALVRDPAANPAGFTITSGALAIIGS